MAALVKHPKNLQIALLPPISAEKELFFGNIILWQNFKTGFITGYDSVPLLWRTFRAETDAIYLFAFYILQHHLITAVQTLANLFSFLRSYHSHCQITVLKPHPNSYSWHFICAYFLRSHSLWVALNIHKCQPAHETGQHSELFA